MKFKVNEKGFTLLELLVAMSIGALVISAASMTIITMMRLSPKSTDWTIALRQVQNAGYLISRDALMSQTIEVGTGNPTFLTLTQPQVDTDDRTIVYELEDMPDGAQRLMRDDPDGEPIMIAQYISEATADYYPGSDNGTLIFTIEATYGEATIQRTYETMQRVPPPQ